MSLRCLHIADLHIGKPCGVTLPLGRARLRRLETVQTLQRVIDYCERERVDILLIAGDFLEQNCADPLLVRQISDMFQKAPSLNVLIAPGNHDPLGLDSYYKTVRWPDHVHIFPSETMSSWSSPTKPLTVHGLGWQRTHIPEPLLADYRVPADGRRHIILIHGDICSDRLDSEYLPITRQQMLATGADYIALGHIHQAPTPIYDWPEKKAAYAGSLEPLSFQETGRHGGWLIEFPELAADRPFVLTKVEFARRLYETKTYVCSADDDMFALQEKIEHLWTEEERENNFCRVVLEGHTDLLRDHGVAALAESLREKFYYIDIVDRTEREYDLDALARQYDGTIVERFLAQFNELQQMHRQIAATHGDAVTVVGDEHIDDGPLDHDTESRHVQLYQLALTYGLDALFGREVKP